MSCIAHLNLCPSSGDTEVVLLQKILQSLNEGSSGGGVAGVSSISVNGGPAETGAVSLTIPAATSPLLNFTDENANADGVAWRNSGATEVFRTVGATGHVQFQGAATRLHSTGIADSFTFLATAAKADGAFLEVYGTGHPTGLGGATVSIHDGGQFRVRSAPVASTVSVLHFLVDGTTGFVGLGAAATTPLTRLDVRGSVTVGRTSLIFASHGIDALITANPTANVQGIVGVAGEVDTTNSNPAFTNFQPVGVSATIRYRGTTSESASGKGARSVDANMFVFNTGTTQHASGFRLDSRNLSTGTVTNLYGAWVPTMLNSGGGVITNIYGIKVDAQDAATNNYGVFSMVAAAAGRWNFYASGTAQNFLAGKLGIGATAINPVANLDIQNSTATTLAYIYHTADGTGTPTNYSRLTLSHNAAATGFQTANFLAETGGTGVDNIDIRLGPAGSGGLYIGPIADGTATGGNARGTNCVDLQLIRSAATQVASGATSICVSNSSTASGIASCVVGGDTNVASGLAATCVGGSSNTASATDACTIGGARAVANKFCQNSQASGRFVVDGDAQTSTLVARRQTTDGTGNVELFLDGNTATLRCTIATDTTWNFHIYLVARRTDVNGDYATWEISGGISNDAGVTALNSAVNIVQTSASAGAATWAATAVADNGNDALVAQVTGQAAKTINWVARIVLTETTG